MRFVRGRSTPAIRAISRESFSVLRSTGQLCSALPLLVLLVRADHAHHTLAPHDLALVTDFLDRRSDLHETPLDRLANPGSRIIRSSARSARASGRAVKAPAGRGLR